MRPGQRQRCKPQDALKAEERRRRSDRNLLGEVEERAKEVGEKRQKDNGCEYFTISKRQKP